MAKKFLSILLTLVLVLGLLPAAGAAAVSTSPTFSDMPDNWATEALESAVANGLLVGDDGKIMPDSPLTRAQMATIIARAFGATEEGDISVYADVKSTDWFAVSMAKAYKMGVMQGYAGKMDPNSNITREQAFAVLARALKLEISSSINKTFEDEGEISDWAKGEVYALVNAGYIQGSNGRLNPQANISRAEFAQMMHNLIKQYIKAEGEYTQVADGNIMVNVPNVTLKNVTITGDLIVGDGVGDGDLILDNVTIKGRLLARGGGVNSIIIIGGSVEGKVIVAKVDGDIRVSVEGGADVEVIVIDDGKDDVIIEGTVGTVEVSVPDVPVIIQNATISKIDVNCEGAADITIAETGSVTNVVIGGNSEGTALNVEGNVTNIETSAPDTVISGTGAVGTVTANEGADNTSVTTPNTVVNNEGASAVTAGGGKEVPEDSSATNNNQGTDVITTPPSGGEPSYVAVSAISVNKTETLLKPDATETLLATVEPSNATNKTVTWSSDNEDVATVDATGKITAVAAGEATITAKAGGITATTTVVVSDSDVFNIMQDKGYDTIQAAVNEAEAGDTILVNGEFEGFTVNKAVTIKGGTINSTTIPATSGNIGVYIPANVTGVVFNGVKIAGVGENPRIGIEVGANAELTVKGSEITDFPTGIYLNPGSELTATGNTISNALAGIGSEKANLTGNISGNTFEVCTSEGIGLYLPIKADGAVMSKQEAEALAVALGNANTFTDCTEEAVKIYGDPVEETGIEGLDAEGNRVGFFDTIAEALANTDVETIVLTEEVDGLKVVSVRKLVSYETEGEVTDIAPEGITFVEGYFLVPPDVIEFTFKDGDRDMLPWYDAAEWHFRELVAYEANGDVMDIDPDTVTYREQERKFLVPEGVTEFTFKDDGGKKKATFAGDKWTIALLVLSNYRLDWSADPNIGYYKITGEIEALDQYENTFDLNGTKNCTFTVSTAHGSVSKPGTVTFSNGKASFELTGAATNYITGLTIEIDGVQY